MTRGFSAFTSEDARRIDIARVPVELRDVRVLGRNGEEFGLFDDREGRAAAHRVMIVSFMYTRCVTVCTATGSSFEQLQRDIVSGRLRDSMRLVTVSIDPENDSADALARYADRVHADPGVWTVASIARGQDLRDAMRSFGVVLLRLPSGEIQHNAAFHIVDGERRLRAVVDIDSPLTAAEIARSLALPPAAS